MSKPTVLQDQESVGALRLMLRKGYTQEQIVNAYEILLRQEAEFLTDALLAEIKLRGIVAPVTGEA